jgi:hypothetical protein
MVSPLTIVPWTDCGRNGDAPVLHLEATHRAGYSWKPRRISQFFSSSSFTTRGQWSEKFQSVMPRKDKEQYLGYAMTFPMLSQRTRYAKLFVSMQNLPMRLQIPHREAGRQ